MNKSVTGLPRRAPSSTYAWRYNTQANQPASKVTYRVEYSRIFRLRAQCTARLHEDISLRKFFGFSLQKNKIQDLSRTMIHAQAPTKALAWKVV